MGKLSDEWRTPDDLFQVLDRGGEYMGMTFAGFNFDIDLCANHENHKVDLYCTQYLTNYMCYGKSCINFQEYVKRNNLTCFMNPPYSNPKPFIEKAWEDSKHCKIVCLVKCDPSTKWWATFWDYSQNKYEFKIQCYKCDGYKDLNIFNVYASYRKCHICDGKGYLIETKKYKIGSKPGCEVIFFPKRIQFDPPPGYTGKVSSPSFPSAIVIMDRREL